MHTLETLCHFRLTESRNLWLAVDGFRRSSGTSYTETVIHGERLFLAVRGIIVAKRYINRIILSARFFVVGVDW